MLEGIAADGLWVIAPVQPQLLPKDPVFKLLGSSDEATLQASVYQVRCTQLPDLDASACPLPPALNCYWACNPLGSDILPLAALLQPPAKLKYP